MNSVFKDNNIVSEARKMNKKLLILPLTMTLLAACNGNNPTSSTDTNTDATNSGESVPSETSSEQGSKTDEKDRVTLVNNVSNGVKKSYEASFDKGVNFTSKLELKGKVDTSTFSDGLLNSNKVDIENITINNKATYKNIGDKGTHTGFNDIRLAEELLLNVKNVKVDTVQESPDYDEAGQPKETPLHNEVHVEVNEIKDALLNLYLDTSNVYIDRSNIDLSALARANMPLFTYIVASMNQIDPSQVTEDMVLNFVSQMDQAYPKKILQPLDERQRPQVDLPDVTSFNTSVDGVKTQVLTYLNLYKDYFTLLKDANDITTLNINLDKEAIKEIVLMNSADDKGMVSPETAKGIEETFKSFEKADVHFGVSFDKDFYLSNVNLKADVIYNQIVDEKNYQKINLSLNFNTDVDFNDPIVIFPANFDDYSPLPPMGQNVEEETDTSEVGGN